MLTRDKMTARALYDWTHRPRTKFRPGDRAVVDDTFPGEDYWQPGDRIRTSHSQRLADMFGREGTVFAVSCASNGQIRGVRQHTTYWIEFDDGEVAGFQSHFLRKV